MRSFKPLDVRLRGARHERQRGVAGVQVGGVRDLIGDHGAAGAGPLRVRTAPA